MDSSIYFGLPGQLRKLYDPTGGMLATRDIATSVFITGDGGARVNKAYGGNRTFVLNYGALGRESFDWLNNFQQGHMGPGPFVLLNPGQRNLLTVNQSSATSATNDTRELTAVGGFSSLSSDATLSTPFPKTLKWSFTGSGGSALVMDNASKLTSWYGIPVTQQPYTFWCMVVGGPMDMNMTIQWRGATGNVILDQYGPALTTHATNWQRAAISGAVPPAGALWARPRIVPVTASISAGESLWFSSFMFHEGTSPEPWAGGTGVYPVQVVSVPERYAFAEPGMVLSPALTLQEVR